VLFATNMLARALLGSKKVAPYVPDFTTAFEHICIHTGGHADLVLPGSFAGRCVSSHPARF
jgi:hypothetical protein